MGLKDVLIAMSYSLVMMISIIVSWHKLLNKKINFRDYKLYITLIGMDVLSAINFLSTYKYIRILLITMAFVVFCKFLLRESIQKSLLTPIYSQVLVFFAELAFVPIYVLTFGKYEDLAVNTITVNYITNAVIALLLFILVHFKFVQNIYNRFLTLTSKIKTRQLIIFSLIGMVILNVFIVGAYYKIKLEYFVLINVCLIVFVLLLIVYSFKTQNNYNIVSDNYNVAKNSLKDYEAMMTKYRIANHENKNMLLAVRAMVVNKEKNIPEYIDSIIENKFADDEKLLLEMNVIPEGGLRATMYSEILKIKENKIKYNLSIDRKISTIDLIELDTNTTIGVCKIVSVFIDNSIEAVKQLKNKVININMYLENNKLCIKVANNYKGYIDISKINDEGYTTKGSGHGYGLCLVKNIIDNNSLFENKTEVNKNTFSQILKITYKKNH